MDSHSLTQLTEEHLERARASSSGRSAVTIHGGHEHRLRQTLIVLASGQALGEHEAPDEATLQVVRGEVRLSAGAESWEGSAGDHVVIPRHRHDLLALTDAAVLLTVAVV